MTDTLDWAALGKQVIANGYAILDAEASAKMDARTQALAFSLLARTLSNFSGAMSLLARGYLVEARALVRCCFENEFFLGGLQSDPKDFWRKLEEDDVKHRQMLSKQFFEMADPTDIDEDVSRRVREWLAKSKAEHPKPKKLTPKEVSAGSRTYIAYSQLSSDAGHASLSSLRRHMSRDDEDRLVFTARLEPSDEEIIDTFKWGCLSVIRSCGVVNEMLGLPEDNGIRESVDEFARLLPS